MIRTFANSEIKSFFTTGQTGLWKKGLLKQMAAMRLLQMDAATDVLDLQMPPSNELAKLEDDRVGWWAIQLTKNCILYFRFEKGDAYDLEIPDIQERKQTMISDNGLPAVHPGAFLSEILRVTGISQSELARRIGVSRMSILQLIHQKRRMTIEMACLLGKFFHQTPEYWLNLQVSYDLKMLDSKMKERIERVQPVDALSPVQDSIPPKEEA